MWLLDMGRTIRAHGSDEKTNPPDRECRIFGGRDWLWAGRLRPLITRPSKVINDGRLIDCHKRNDG
jgi:hypothetical protein